MGTLFSSIDLADGTDETENVKGVPKVSMNVSRFITNNSKQFKGYLGNSPLRPDPITTICFHPRESLSQASAS
jgi:hypothetical protein